MTAQAPKIDKRTYQDVVVETEALVKDLTPWRPRADGQPDAGGALIRIFGRMAELVIERLNQAPDKNFLTFLDLIGTPILPPQPARVPLTFRLAIGASEQALAPLPARTQAAAPPVEGEKEEVVFETDQDLMLTATQLSAVFVRDPGTDQYSDYTGQAMSLTDQPFDAFIAHRPIEHSLYLAQDDFLTLPGVKKLTLTFNSPDAVQLANLPMTWSVWDSQQWQQVSITSNTSIGSTWEVVIDRLPTPGLCTVNGVQAGWLRARLGVPWPRGKMAAPVGSPERISVQRQNLRPDKIIVGRELLSDSSQPFFPFGEEETPVFVYINLEEVFVRAGAAATIHVALARAGSGLGNPTLHWTYSTGDNGWALLGQSTPSTQSLGASAFNFRDGSNAFTREGDISFTVPANWSDRTLFSQPGRWLRIQVQSGNYGRRPPQIRSTIVGYSWTLPQIDQISAEVMITNSDLSPDLGFVC